MPRRVARTSRSNDASAAGAVSVVAGSIRTADDPTALEVKLSIWETEITMRADGSELGHWPADAVAIKPIDAFSFEFVAEGDHLIFLPNNPDEFRDHPAVSGGLVGKRRRKKSKTKAKPEPERPAELRWDESTEAETQSSKKRSRAAKDSIPTRRERKAAAKAAKEAVAAASTVRQSQVPVVDYDAAPARSSAPPVEVEEDISASGYDHDAGTNGESTFTGLRQKVWMSSLDLARRYDLFGLDRVPVSDAQRRDPNHKHTWDHRVAPASGPGSFICTICGARRKNG